MYHREEMCNVTTGPGNGSLDVLAECATCLQESAFTKPHEAHLPHEQNGLSTHGDGPTINLFRGNCKSLRPGLRDSLIVCVDI